MMARAPRGFVLITVLVALVLLAVVAERLNARVSAYRERQGGWQQVAEDESAIAAARDEVLFAMLTHQLSQIGFGSGRRTLRVDGRPYRLPSGIMVSVQDSRGLISIAEPDPDMLQQFLRNHGVAARDLEPMVDKLQDYMDTDDLHRLNGAEADAYRRAGMPPPRNDWPVSPFELRLVLGWAERPSLWLRASDVFTQVRDGYINPNTAGPEVLATLPGATPEGIRKLLEYREKRVLTSAADTLTVGGIQVVDDPVAFYAGRFYRLRIWRADARQAVELTVMLTPGAPKRPWLVMETRLVERPAAAAAESYIAPFPLPIPAGRGSQTISAPAR
jgi:type II secretory pathway component PulK